MQYSPKGNLFLYLFLPGMLLSLVPSPDILHRLWEAAPFIQDSADEGDL